MNPGDLVKVFKHGSYSESDVLGVGLYLGSEQRSVPHDSYISGRNSSHDLKDAHFKVLLNGEIQYFDSRYHTLFLVPGSR